MQPYCDLDFLVALVVNSTASPVAYAAIRLFSPPYGLNSHYLGCDGPARQIARTAGLKLLPA